MAEAPEAIDRLLSTAEVAAWVGVTEETLRYWRHKQCGGPKWFRLDRKSIKYRTSDVQAWLDEQYAKVNGAA